MIKIKKCALKVFNFVKKIKFLKIREFFFKIRKNVFCCANHLYLKHIIKYKDITC